MNTKNILFTCLLLLVTLSAATVVYKQKSLLRVPAETAAATLEAVATATAGNQESRADHSPPHPDDDGKYHDFHFERILQLRRGRLACIFCAKTVVALIHLAVLLLGYFSVGH